MEILAADICITHDLASEDNDSFLAQVRSVLPVRNVSGLGFRTANPPSTAEVIAEALTWTTVLKAAATLFLSQLAKNAADEVWKNKAELLKVLGTATVRPLHTLARAFSAINQRTTHSTDARVALPYPDSRRLTGLPIHSTNELEAAWLLANFVLNTERLRAEVKSLLASGAEPMTGFFVKISPEGEVSLDWFELGIRKSHRLASQPDASSGQPASPSAR